MLRVVLDTNVLVSAVISDGKARDLLKKGLAGKYRIVTSDLILKELAVVLTAPNSKPVQMKLKELLLRLTELQML